MHVESTEVDSSPGTIRPVGIRFARIRVFDDNVSTAVPWELGIIRHNLPQGRVNHFKICAGVEFDDVDSIFEKIGEERFIACAFNDRIRLLTDMRHGKEIARCTRFVELHEHRPIFDGIASGFIIRDIAPIHPISLKDLLWVGYVNVFLNALADTCVNPASFAFPDERHLFIGGIRGYQRGWRRCRCDVAIVI